MASLLIRFKNQKIVNIKNVTSIALFPDKFRIVFNMNYSITLPNSSQLISDYVYWEATSLDQYKEMFNSFRNMIDRWVESPSFGIKRFINPEYISSIVMDSSDKYKIIFNLSHTISMKNSEGLTSEYIYFKFNDLKEFNQYKDKLLVVI